jgi:hypothetical protein
MMARVVLAAKASAMAIAVLRECIVGQKYLKREVEAERTAR